MVVSHKITPYQAGVRYGRENYHQGQDQQTNGAKSEKAAKKYPDPNQRREFVRGANEGYSVEKDFDISIKDQL